MPSKNLYRQLLTDICTLYEATQGLGEEARRKQTIFNYWKISRHINQLEKQGVGAYGKNLVGRLSKDLTEKYGSGFRKRTVEYIRDFSKTYKLADLNTPLSWSHYKALMVADDLASRRELEAIAIAQHIGAKRLERLVRQINKLKSGGADEYADDTAQANSTMLEELLQPRIAQLGIYKVMVDPWDGGETTLDLGFRVQIEMPDSKFAHGQYVTRLENQFQPVDCKPGERYCYRARLLNVVDGDTVNVKLDLGFGVFKKERLRLKCVGAPEMTLDAGKKAREFIMRRVKIGTEVTVLTYGVDRYGRYVADIFYQRNRERHLNLECIKSGLTCYMDPFP